MPCLLKASRRCFQLYAAHILLCTATFTLIYLYALREVRLGDAALYSFLTQPWQAAVHLFSLSYIVHYLAILPIYILFVAVTPFAVYLIDHGREWVLMAASLGTYLAAQFTDINLYAWPTGRPWFFNVLAWQLIFVIGLLLGGRRSRGFRWRPPAWVVALAAAGLLAVFLVRVGSSDLLARILNTDVLQEIRAALPRVIPLTAKPEAEPLRIVNLLCLAAIAALLPAAGSFWRGRLARPVVICGEMALVAYCLMTFFNYVVLLIEAEHDSPQWVVLTLMFAGFCLTAGVAFCLRSPDARRSLVTKVRGYLAPLAPDGSWRAHSKHS